MAANSAKTKRSLLSGAPITFDELFNLQNELDTGISSPIAVKTGEWSQPGSFFTHGSSGSSFGKADASNLGSILGQSEAINAYKKRRLEQQTLAKQGTGISQSILGGSVI